MRRFIDRGNEPPPRGYGWTIKLTLAVALLLLAMSQFLQLAYVAPTAKSSADTARTLAQEDAITRQKAACYDLLSSAVFAGNADVLDALIQSSGAVGDLVVALAAQPRDRSLVSATIGQIHVASRRNAVASASYHAANQTRTDWIAAGRPLPCPRTS